MPMIEPMTPDCWRKSSRVSLWKIRSPRNPLDERADDADDADDRGQDADVLSTVDQQPCNCAGDQSDD